MCTLVQIKALAIIQREFDAVALFAAGNKRTSRISNDLL